MIFQPILYSVFGKQNLPLQSKEIKLHFKFLHSIVETKKELCRLGIKDDSEAELTTN